MRIALIGQAAFGKSVLDAIVNGGKDTVVGVFCPPDKPGAQSDPVKTSALASNVPCYQFKRMRSPEAIEQFRALQADLCVMAFVTDIVPQEILSAPRLGTIQYHPSLLPKHRGPSSINWPIIFGENETGLTIFWPDAGLDTGPVLLQKRIPIGPDDTLGTIYFDQLMPMGVAAMVEAVELVRHGKAPKIPQDESRATYEGWCTDEHANVDWSKPAQQVHNLIRGCNPRPGAFTTSGGARLRLFDSELRPHEAGHRPGAIAAISSAGMEIAANGGHVLVKRVQLDGGKKIPAAEFAAVAGLQQGTLLGS